MPHRFRIALVGDYDPTVPAHQAIPPALHLAAQSLGLPLEPVWTPTDTITSSDAVAGFDGIWCVPASPYRSMAGALTAIRFARESQVPFLGTCGGFQHAVIEYARNVLGWLDADHAETNPDAERLVIAPLACPLVEARGSIRFLAETRLARAYGTAEAVEGYRCSYGVNPAFAAELARGPLRVTATDGDDGSIRGVELDGHPFFVATLFQPERAALTGKLPPIARAFATAVAARPAPAAR